MKPIEKMTIEEIDREKKRIDRNIRICDIAMNVLLVMIAIVIIFGSFLVGFSIGIAI